MRDAPSPVMRWVTAVAAGSLMCTLCDQVHVHTGVLAYRVPAVAGQAAWVPLVFVLAAFAGLAQWSLLARLDPAVRRDLAGGSRDRWGTREAVYAVVWMVLIYSSSGFVQGAPRAAFAVYVVLFMLRAWSLRAPGVVTHALLFAVGGTAFEAVLSSTGAFWYTRPELFGVPVWLPGLYLHGAFVARAVMRRWLVG
ncbi:MAG: hypothetical protein U0325_08380 [Polyangiales bacterium]